MVFAIKQQVILLFFALLRSAICGCKLEEKEKELLTNEYIEDVVSLSKKHDIAHLIAYGLSLNKLLNNESSNIYNEIMKAVYRYEQLNYEYCKLCEALEKAQIPFIPLKGSVIRKYYPEPWMRTSCDIDILVKESDVEIAVDYLVSNYGYSCEKKSSHDISLYSTNNNHLELHYDLVEQILMNNACKVLKTVWENTTTYGKYDYWYVMSDEMFYFYHIAHIVKHFESGGCGIRPFIDLWILDNIDRGDRNKKDELLEDGGLLKFSEVSRQLCRVWFENEEHTAITKQMEQYIVNGGVYGSLKNRVKIQGQKEGGKWKYVFFRIFLPYEHLKLEYPCLIKNKWLTPIVQLRRWFRIVFGGRIKHAAKEIKYSVNINTDEVQMTEFLKDIGL